MPAAYLTPETPETANWGRVFRLKLRLEESLKAEFSGWLVEIGGFLRGLAFNLGIIEEVKAGLLRYKDACSLESLPSVALLKEGVASVLLQGLEAEEQSERTHNPMFEHTNLEWTQPLPRSDLRQTH